jgi:hypothetical protein
LAGTNFSIIESLIIRDTELQQILKNSTGSIHRLSELVGGSEYLRQIWHANKESIRSKTCKQVQILVSTIFATLHDLMRIID